MTTQTATTTATAAKIAEIIAESDYEFYGIRFATPNPENHEEDMTWKAGDILPNSYHWEDGESLGYELNGVCAIELDTHDPERIQSVIDYVKKRYSFGDGQMMLVAGTTQEAGQDFCHPFYEVIINHSDYYNGDGAVALYVWEVA